LVLVKKNADSGVGGHSELDGQSVIIITSQSFIKIKIL